jgi:hypothetical protein
MANPIDILKELITVGDTAPLERLIAQIESLDRVYESMVENSKRNTREYTTVINSVIKSAEDLEQQIKDLDATDKAQQETLVKSATEAEKLLATNEQMTKSLKLEEQQLAALVEIQNKLNQAKEKANKAKQHEAGSLDDLKQKLKEATAAYSAMGDSTDALAKSEALNRVTELSKAVAQGDEALKSAKKAADHAKGSYDELAAKVAAAKRALKEMEGGIGSNTQEFKDLQKFVKEGSDQLKDFDKAVGDNQRNVGNYPQKLQVWAQQLDELKGAFDGSSGALKQLTKSAIAFIMTPIGAIIAGVALAVSALSAYFKSSTEGQDNWNKILTVSQVLLENLVDVLEWVGEVLYTAFFEPQKVLKELSGLLSPMAKDLQAVFDNPLQAVKDLGQAIVDNVINRLKGLALYGPAIRKIFSKDWKEGLRDLADASIQVGTGVTDGTKKIADMAGAAYDFMSDKMREFYEKQRKEVLEALAVAELENKFKKEAIQDIIDDAKTELSVNKLLAQVKDKLRFSDEERLAALQKANALLEEQVKGDIELAKMELEFTRRRLELDGLTYEEKQKIAELQAKVINTESAFFQAQKKRLSEEAALINEIAKAREEKVRREIEAERGYQAALINGRIAANKEILDDDRSTLEERLTALQEIAIAQEDLAQQAHDKALEGEKAAAMDRVQLNSETLDKIYGNTSLSLDQKLALEAQAKEAAIEGDAAYVNAKLKLDEELLQNVVKINGEMTDATEDNVFKQYLRDYENLVAKTEKGAAEEQVDLFAAFENGDIDAEQLAEMRQKVQEEAQIKSLQSQLDYLKKMRDNLAAAGHDTTQLSASIANTELALAETKNAGLIAKEEELQEALHELKAVAYETALSIADSIFEAENIRSEERLAKLEENFNNELLLAGDNEAKKAELTNVYNQQKKKIEKEQAEAARKRAVFDKGVAVFQIGLNTAMAISKAVEMSPATGGLPMSAIVAAIGALQIAAVLAKPIPAFAAGTDDSPEGLAIVNEKGPELIQSPSGRLGFAAGRGPTLTHLEKGSKIYTADETRRILSGQEIPDRMVAGFDDDTQKLRFIKVETDNAQLERVLSKKFDELIHTTRTKQVARLDARGVAEELANGLNMASFINSEYR